MLAHIEPLRKDKRIGSSLQARVVLTPSSDDLAFLKRHERDLPMLFRTRANPATEETDISPVMSGGPQANAFNAFAAKTMHLDAWRMNDKALFRYGNDVNGMDCSIRLA